MTSSAPPSCTLARPSMTRYGWRPSPVCSGAWKDTVTRGSRRRSRDLVPVEERGEDELVAVEAGPGQGDVQPAVGVAGHDVGQRAAREELADAVGDGHRAIVAPSRRLGRRAGAAAALPLS